MRANGSNLRRLTYESRAPALSPAWAPDCMRLVARWLTDSHRLMFCDEHNINLLDSRSGKFRELPSMAPHDVGGSIFTLARDDRTIAFVLEVTEADVWLMSQS